MKNETEKLQEAIGYVKLFCGIHVKNRQDKDAISERFYIIEEAAQRTADVEKREAVLKERLRAYTVNDAGDEIDLPEDVLHYAIEDAKATYTALSGCSIENHWLKKRVEELKPVHICVDMAKPNSDMTCVTMDIKTFQKIKEVLEHYQKQDDAPVDLLAGFSPTAPRIDEKSPARLMLALLQDRRG